MSENARKTPRQARSQATVATILEAATRILTERGMDGFNTNVVARRAGVSIGSIYQYFPNKESLLGALRDRHSSDMSEAMEALGTGQHGSLREDIEKLVRAAMAAHESDPLLHKVLDQHVALAHTDHQSGERVRAYVTGMIARHGEKVGHEKPQIAAWMTMRMMETLVHGAVLDRPAGFDMREVEKSIADALYGFLLGSRQAQ